MTLHLLYACLVGLAVYLFVLLLWRSGSHLPPGPVGWPVIGNLLDILTQELPTYKALGAMSSKYGPIIRLKVLRTEYIFLNSFKVTKDLLEKRSAVTADRPHFLVGGDLVGWGNVTPFLPYGDAHRRHRKLFGQHVWAKNNLVTFYPVQEAEARQFVRNVLKNPDDLKAHCRRTTASLIFKISHGYDVKDDHDPLVELASGARRSVSETMAPGCFVADHLPILRYLPEWFPGGGFHKYGKRWRTMVNEAVNAPHEFVLEHLAKGDATPSFTSRMLQECVTPEDEETLKWTSFTMYLGGSEMTPSMLSAFFLAMTMYPDVLKKAQAEVDIVVGNDRLPTIEDRDALPYVNAICTELLRWNVVVPLIVHVSTEDIMYEGYLIPKGSWLLPNTGFILSDPRTYPDPDVFDPERFLGEDHQPDPREACFGWGRRLCLGARLAESMIFIYVATALATLEVSRYIEDGIEWIPKYEFEGGVIRDIKPFKCKIVGRSKQAMNLLQVYSE